MLTFDREAGTLRFIAPGCEIENWRMGIEVGGERFDASGAEVKMLGGRSLRFMLTFPDVRVVWSVQCETDEAAGRLIIRSTLTNRSGRRVALGKACLLDTADVAFGETDGNILCLPLSGEIVPRVVSRLGDAACPRESKIKVQFFDRASHRALQVGFLSFQRADTEVHFDCDPDGGIAGLRAWCDFAGWELEPAESTQTETFVLMVGDDPHTQLETWADLAAGLCAPRRWEDAPIGWVGWAWVDPFTVERYEEVVLRNCEAIRRRLKGFGVDYVWVSLGNLADVNPGDWLNWNTGFFPRGPHAFGAKLREMGFRWGLWCGVFWMCSLLDEKVAEYGDALLKDSDGAPMVVRPEWQYGAGGEMPVAERPCMYALDPSHPKTLALLRETFETYRAWGVRYYMLDFLHAGAGNIGRFPYAHHHDGRLVAGPEAYQNALRTVREAAGDDTYFLSSSGPTVHNAGIVDAARTGNDFGEGRALYPDSYFYPATFAINSGSVWTGPLRALTNQASAYYTHRKLYINDSGNVLTVDKPLPLGDAQVHATIHALSGGPSMIGDDVDRMDEERLSLIKVTLPRSRDVAFPVDLFDSPAPDHPKVFHRKVVKPWGRFDVVAVYNFTEEMLRTPVALARLGLKDDADYLVWEFWNAEYVGRTRGALQAAVPPGSVRVYRLVEDVGAPALLGTDMHLLMGEMEVASCAWDAEERTLIGRALRPSGESGSVFIHAPPGLRVADPQGLWIARDAREDSLIIRASLSFEEGTAGWRIRFADLGEAVDMTGRDLT